jgi:hypothetical protein
VLRLVDILVFGADGGASGAGFLVRRVFFFELTVIHSPSSLFWLDFCDPFDRFCLAAGLVDEVTLLSPLFAMTPAFLSLELLLLLEAVTLLGVSFFGVAFFGELLLVGLCLAEEDLLFDLDDLFESCDDLNRNKYTSPMVDVIATTTASKPRGELSTRVASSLNLLSVAAMFDDCHNSCRNRKCG